MKLPEDVVVQVLAKRGAERLVMGKRVMREWVLLRMEDYRGEVESMRVAMEFVRQGKKAYPRG